MTRPSIVEARVERQLSPTAEDRQARFRAAERLPGLTGLRGLAILPVIWHHATPRLLPGIWGKGAVGVDLFFALSGFLITQLLLRERRATARIALGAFYARRSLRIFPLYYAVLACYALRAWQTRDLPMSQHFLDGLVYQGTYTANWFLNYAVPHPVVFAFSWSLCVEEQFYLLWPGLLSLCRGTLVPAVSMLTLITIDWLAEHGALPALAPGSLALRMVTSFATPIGFGALLALLLDTPRGFAWAWPVLGRRAAAPLLLLASLWCLAQAATPYLTLSLCLSGLVAACALRADNGLAWLLEQAFLERLGVLSYALYLLHVTALGLIRRLLPTLSENTLVVFGLGLPLSILLAEVAHRAVERPFLRLRSQLRPAVKAEAGPSSAAVAGIIRR